MIGGDYWWPNNIPDKNLVVGDIIEGLEIPCLEHGLRLVVAL